MIIKQVILFCCMLLGVYITKAQVGNVNLLDAPQSPTAASLGKYVEIPVGHYSGIPQVGVPLCDFQVKGFQLPVSLSYHASGIKVKEIPGPVGAGWSLNAGGVITRIVRGYPDDHDNPSGQYRGDDYYDSITKIRVVNAYISGYTSEFSTTSEQTDLCLSTPGVKASELPNYRMDTEIDLFYFNFLGYTGEFTFTNEGIPMLLSAGDLKIEYNDRTYKITDGSGVVYFFEALEQALDDNMAFDFYTTSWYLSKIVIPHQDQVITFSYKNFDNYSLHDGNLFLPAHPYGIAVTNRVDRLRYLYEIHGNKDGSPRVFMGCPSYTVLDLSPGIDIHANGLFIDEINWGDKKIKFYGGTTRTDLYKYKFDSIKVFAGNKELRHIQLDYSYFNNEASQAGDKKLKLDQVSVNDQVYQFDYIESFDGRSLPGITAQGQDIWGYYNGEDDETGIPYYKVFQNFPGVLLENVNSASYNPDYQYGQIGSLRSITYPTGSEMRFEYEGNDYSFYPFLSSYHTIEEDPYTQMKFSSTMLKTCEAFTAPQHSSTHYNVAKEREFVLHKDQVVNISLFLGQFPFDNLNDYVDSVYGWNVSAEAYLQKYNVQTEDYEDIAVYRISPPDSIGLPTDQYDYDQLKDKSLLDKIYELYLSEGQYKLALTLRGWYMIGDISLEVAFPYKKTPYIYNAGGIRIKRVELISHTDVDTSYVKEYAYKYKGDTLSSGVLESPFSNISTSAFADEINIWMEGEDSYLFQETCGFYNVSSSPLIPLGNSKGGIIGYASVMEKREDNSKKWYHFTNGQDYPGVMSDRFVEGSILPTRTRLSVDNSWKRGLPKQIDYYNYQDILVRQDFSRYLYDNDTTYNRSISFALENVFLLAGATPFNGYSAFPTFIVRGNQNAYKTRDSTVLYTTAGAVSTVTHYAYHTSSYPHTYPQQITHRNSMEEQIISHFKYPQDYSVGESPTDPTAVGIKNLLDRHVVSVPIEQYVEKKDADGGNARIIQGQYVRYKESLPFPDTVFQLKVSAPLSDFQTADITASSSSKDSRYKGTINFHQFDDYGNVMEQSRQSGVKEVFIWGYDHQYPVAKIVGSDYNTAIALVDTTLISNPATDQQLQTELHKLRTGLPHAMVTTYSYAPLVGVTSEVGSSGQKLYYSYDAQGRLALIMDQNRRILKKICYNYQGQPEACDWYGNAAVNENFVRNDCGVGYQGDTIAYVVPANTYYAYSQSAADSLAQADAATKGPAYANANGSCHLLYYNVEKSGQFTRNNCGSGYTGSTVTYTVSAGTYSTTASQSAANSLAQADVNANGQNYANTNATCVANDISIFYEDYGGASHPYYFLFINLDTDEEYEFQTNPYAPSGYPVYLGMISPGDYSIVIDNPYNAGPHHFDTCTDAVYSSYYPTYVYGTFTTSCDFIIIDY